MLGQARMIILALTVWSDACARASVALLVLVFVHGSLVSSHCHYLLRSCFSFALRLRVVAQCWATATTQQRRARIRVHGYPHVSFDFCVVGVHTGREQD